jgi:hypothetical protein
MRLEGDQVTSVPWDAQGEAHAAANRSARLRLLATGVLFGFGIQTVLLFAGYEFYVRSPDRAGPGGAVGILGGIVLLVAALIAAASRPASAAVTSGSVSG